MICNNINIPICCPESKIDKDGWYNTGSLKIKTVALKNNLWLIDKDGQAFIKLIPSGKSDGAMISEIQPNGEIIEVGHRWNGYAVEIISFSITKSNTLN